MRPRSAEAALAPAEEALPADTKGVLEACQLIGPGMDDVRVGHGATVTTPEDYVGPVDHRRAHHARECPPTGTTDPVFIQDVQLLSDDLGEAADAVTNGEDPSYLQDAPWPRTAAGSIPRAAPRPAS